MRFYSSCAMLVFGFYLSIIQTAHAQYTFTTIDVPGAVDTFLTGINDRGDLVGGYTNEIFGPAYAFFTQGDSLITIAVPGSSDTTAFGINNHDKIVGSFVTDEQHGFVYSSKRQKFKQIDVPFPTGVFLTRVNGINNRGQSVGEYLDHPTSNEQHGFLYSNGEFSSIDVPHAEVTSANSINNQGQIVGFYADRFTLQRHGFVTDGEEFTSVDVPFLGASNTVLTGINRRGQIVGIYDDSGGVHGFVKDAGIFTTIDVLGAFETVALGINRHGEIVGWYSDGVGIHGFVAIPDNEKKRSNLLTSNIP
jgi:uncharacterized membrane protein